ncbi:MAG: hypothetical protein MRY83_03300 [Flavobacteriales bacterium]|nr:hypothetical protein [Flavobacteriales bacterium]
MSQSVIIKSKYSIRAFLLGRVALPMVLLYRNLFKGYKSSWKENRASLNRFEPDTLGKELSKFLYTNNIDLQSKMENHDFFHLVLGYNTTLPEEAALHFFLIGNGKRSHYPIIAALVGFVFFPEYWELYLDAYFRGRRTKKFVTWELQKFLHLKTDTFRKHINLPPRLL